MRFLPKIIYDKIMYYHKKKLRIHYSYNEGFITLIADNFSISYYEI